MAYWSELKAIMQSFPCLWDPQDPYFSEETVKAVCREQVLKICNQRSDVPIEMESLKQWLSDNLAQSTPQLQTAAEEPITALTQDDLSISGEASGNVAQEITATEKLPITILPQDTQSVPSTAGENTAQEMTATEKLPITILPQDTQSVPSTAGENTAQEMTATEKLPITILPQDTQSVPSTAGENTAQEMTATKKPPVIIFRRKCFRVPREERECMARGIPILDDLIIEFPCLWNRADLNYRDLAMRARCMEQLLQKHNKYSNEITMVELRKKVNALRQRLHRGQMETGKSSGTASLGPVEGTPDISTQGTPRLQDMLDEFPCLWDRSDLNYSDNKMRSHCRQQLMEKFNRISNIQITMPDLIRKLRTLQRIDNRNEPILHDLLKEFPCLWNPNDSNFLNETIKEQSQQQLLEKFNRLSSSQMTMSDLNRQLSVLRARREPKFQDLVNEFPCLRDPSKSSDNHSIACNRDQLLEKFNSVSSIKITMSDLLRKLAATRKARKNTRETVTIEPELRVLLKEFPCLWDRNDSSFLDETIKEQSRHQLLEKFNNVSSIQITLRDLKRKLAGVQQRRKRRSKPILEDMAKEYPCLYDPNDVNFSDQVIRTQCLQQLLEKFNRISSVQINMSDLKRKLRPLREKRKCRDESKMQDLVKEFPCLWDPNDLNYPDKIIRRRCLQKLLGNFNKLSSVQINESDLKRRLTSFQRRFRLECKGGGSHHYPKFEDLVEEFPCLWDPGDVNSSDLTIRARCQLQLLDKFNQVSSIQIDMADLKRKLASLQQRRYICEMKGKFPSLAGKQEAAEKQPKVQDISERHLETVAREREPEEISADNFIALTDNSLQTDPNGNIVLDSTESNQRTQGGPNQENLVLQGAEVLFNYCRFCGELKDCSESRNNPKPYLADNKCTLIINDLRAELEFADEIPNICKDCDRKFQEMLDFVKSVKDAQVKLSNFNNGTLDRKRKNVDSLADNNIESEKEAGGQRKIFRIASDFISNTLPPLSDNDGASNDIEMNCDDDIGSSLVIAEFEQTNKSVSINKSPPLLCIENMKITMSHRPRAETTANYITTYTDILKNKPLNDKIYVNRPLDTFNHNSTEVVCEDDVNIIDIKEEVEMADDINDNDETLNTDDNIYNVIDIKEEDIEAVIEAARKKALLPNNCFE